MRTVDYDDKGKNTETQIAVDETIEHKFGNLQRAYNEGFASADGVRGATFDTDGRVVHPEQGDEAMKDSPHNTIEDENPGLADN